MVDRVTKEDEGRALARLMQGVNQAEFAKNNELPGGASMLSQHLSGHRPINLIAAGIYAKGLGVPIASFSPRLAANAAMIRNADVEQVRNAASVENIEPGPDLRGRVPLISWVHAGAPAPPSDPFPPGVAEDWLLCARPHSAGSYALRVRGDSMVSAYGRSYSEGNIIFVDPALRSPCNGQRVIARLDESGEVTFKVYKNEDGRQWLQPLNPSHEPIREPFTVLGTVIGMWVDE